MNRKLTVALITGLFVLAAAAWSLPNSPGFVTGGTGPTGGGIIPNQPNAPNATADVRWQCPYWRARHGVASSRGVGTEMFAGRSGSLTGVSVNPQTQPLLAQFEAAKAAYEKALGEWQWFSQNRNVNAETIEAKRQEVWVHYSQMLWAYQALGQSTQTGQ